MLCNFGSIDYIEERNSKRQTQVTTQHYTVRLVLCMLCRFGSIYDNEVWRNTTAQLVIKQHSSDGRSAAISICRMSELTETSCSDGLDNDCGKAC